MMLLKDWRKLFEAFPARELERRGWFGGRACFI